ncbi:MAG TPA: acyl carrier protein [Candidatus Baltobacteraceae bacterium]
MSAVYEPASGKLLSIIAAVMEADPATIDEGSSFETVLRWDSENEVALGLMLEHHYGITLSDDEMARLHSVRYVRELLASRGITDP